jgi:ABC-type amino acid transport substrate-binding protein
MTKATSRGAFGNGRFGTTTAGALLAACLTMSSPSAAPGKPATDIPEEIRQTGVLRICVVADYAGVTMRDPRSGRLSGLDIDLSRRLARELGASPEYVETTFLRFHEDLDARRCQIAMMGIWVSEKRKERVAFSIPYVTSSAHVVVARANSRLRDWQDANRPGTLLAVVDTPDLRRRAERILPGATKLPAVDSEPMRELLAGRADAVIVDSAMANTLRRNANWARILSPPQPLMLTEIAYAVPKDETAWLQQVNGFVRAIKADGSLREGLSRHGLSGLGIPP